MDLERIGYDDTKIYEPSFAGGVAKCVRVYDGDTVTLAGRLSNSTDDAFYRFSSRLLGVDTPEMRAADRVEREFAEYARDRVRALVLGRLVDVAMDGTDKYGRLLVRIDVRARSGGGEDDPSVGVCVNDYILQKYLGVEYFGGRRPDVNWADMYERAKRAEEEEEKDTDAV